MKRPRFLFVGILVAVTSVVAAGTLLLLGAVAFFDFMSRGSLRSAQPSGGVTVVFADTSTTRLVMADVCGAGGDSPPVNKAAYEALAARGVLTRVASGTKMSLIESGSMFPPWSLSHFTIKDGPWKGKEAWSCPTATRLDHPPL